MDYCNQCEVYLWPPPTGPALAEQHDVVKANQKMLIISLGELKLLTDVEKPKSHGMASFSRPW